MAVQRYATTLLQNGSASPSVGLRRRIPTNEEFLAAVPSGTQFHEITDDLKRGMVEYSESSTIARRERPEITESFRNALILMEQSPEIQEVACGILCDPGVWKAILNSAVVRRITQGVTYTVNAAQAVPVKIVELTETPRGWLARLWEKMLELWEYVKELHDKFGKKFAQKIARMRRGTTSSDDVIIQEDDDLLPQEYDVSDIIIKGASIGITMIMVMMVSVFFGI